MATGCLTTLCRSKDD